MWPNHALQRSLSRRPRRERRGCNLYVPCAGSLSLGRKAAHAHMQSLLSRPAICSAILAMLCLAVASGCGKSTGTGARVSDSSTLVVQPGCGIPKVCEVGMSFAELQEATDDASTHGLYDRDRWSLKKFTHERFVLVPSLGVIGVPERKGALPLLTFYVQPYDSSITSPGLAVTNPFRGRLGSQLSFSNRIVSRKEVETAFGPVTQDLISYTNFSSLPDKTQPFSFRGEQLIYSRLGLDFYL